MDLRQDLCARESTPVVTTVSKELAGCSFRAVQEWYLYTSLHSAVLYSKDWCLDGVRLRGGSVFVHGCELRKVIRNVYFSLLQCLYANINSGIRLTA